MSSKRIITVVTLLVLIAVLVAGILVLEVQNRQAYQDARQILEDRQIQVAATARATIEAPLSTPALYPSVTPIGG